MRLVVPAFLFAVALHAEWLPIEKAIPVAQQEHKLIVLLTRGDAKAETWLADALKENDGFVTARAERATLTGELREYAAAPVTRLLVLDPAGGVVIEPPLAFKDAKRFAAELQALAAHTEAFAAAAAAGKEGRADLAWLIRANALFDAGELTSAQNAYRHAMHERGAAPVVVQRARLGVAMIDANSDRQRAEAMREFFDVARNPVTPEIGATAWLMIAHVRRQTHDRKSAIDAYQKAYAMAPKPSEIADGARHYLEMLGAQPEGVARAGEPGKVQIVYPHVAVLTGDVQVSAVAPPGTARVEFFVDEARVAESSSAPFRATLNLGRVPRPHRLRALAFDGADNATGEGEVAVNAQAVALGVGINVPATVESKATIEITPYVPDGVKLEAVDVFWNDTKLATLTAPPFRTELVLPSRRASGYVRAVVRDASGATAEDVKMVNAPGSIEKVRVDAVEIYALVTDRGGHIVEDLKPLDFSVKEDGRPVAVEVHKSANDPITIGFALDTSGSMKGEMLSIVDYTNEFLHSAMSSGDQALVIAFDEAPHVVVPLTSDLANVGASVANMRASGGTAVWDAIIYSLEQLRGVQGKRALLVFTDGADNGSTATHGGALAYARESGIPVYIVYLGAPLPGGIAARQAFLRRVQPLEALSAATGGVTFRAARREDLPRLFAQVRDETRGEYILTFTSQSKKAPGQARSIEVRVPGRGVRAPSAYVPR